MQPGRVEGAKAPAVQNELDYTKKTDLQPHWRFATDSSVGDEGWFVDDVVVESTSYVCSPVLALPGEAANPGGFTIAEDPGGFLLTWTAPSTGGQGFLVVAHNAAGEGSLGLDSEGEDRPAPAVPGACP